MRNCVLSGLVAVSFALSACGKPAPSPAPTSVPTPTAPEPAPTPTAPEPVPTPTPSAPERAASPEEAVTLYYEGTRDKDGKKLWAIMSTSARTAIEGVKASALKAPEEQLTAVGLDRATVEKMDVREFFEAMVRATPTPAEAIGTTPPSDLKVEGEGTKRTVRFKLGPSFCGAEVLDEDGAWKVESSRCEEG